MIIAIKFVYCASIFFLEQMDEYDEHAFFQGGALTEPDDYGMDLSDPIYIYW